MQVSEIEMLVYKSAAWNFWTNEPIARNCIVIDASQSKQGVVLKKRERGYTMWKKAVREASSIHNKINVKLIVQPRSSCDKISCVLQ